MAFCRGKKQVRAPLNCQGLAAMHLCGMRARDPAAAPAQAAASIARLWVARTSPCSRPCVCKSALHTLVTAQMAGSCADGAEALPGLAAAVYPAHARAAMAQHNTSSRCHLAGSRCHLAGCKTPPTPHQVPRLRSLFTSLFTHRSLIHALFTHSRIVHSLSVYSKHCYDSSMNCAGGRGRGPAAAGPGPARPCGR